MLLPCPGTKGQLDVQVCPVTGPFCGKAKAELLQEGIFFFIHLFARDVLVMKKLETKKNKPAFITSVLQVEY